MDNYGDKEQVEAYLRQMEAGETVIINDAFLDAAQIHFPNDDRINRIRTIPNPAQVGVLDQYEGTMAAVPTETSKHTPGPWECIVGAQYCLHDTTRVSIQTGEGEDNQTIAEVWPADNDMDIADGRLMAVAPELAEAGTDLADWLLELIEAGRIVWVSEDCPQITAAIERWRGILDRTTTDV